MKMRKRRKLVKRPNYITILITLHTASAWDAHPHSAWREIFKTGGGVVKIRIPR